MFGFFDITTSRLLQLTRPIRANKMQFLSKKKELNFNDFFNKMIFLISTRNKINTTI